MTGGRRIQLNDALQQSPSLGEKPAIQVAPPLPVGFARQHQFSLGELKQGVGVSLHRVTGTLEQAVGDPEISGAPRQNGGIDGVLTEQYRIIPPQHFLRLVCLSGFQQRFDQDVGDMGRPHSPVLPPQTSPAPFRRVRSHHAPHTRGSSPKPEPPNPSWRATRTPGAETLRPAPPAPADEPRRATPIKAPYSG